MIPVQRAKLFEKPPLPGDLEPIPAGLSWAEIRERWADARLEPGDLDEVRGGDPRLRIGPRWLLKDLPELASPDAIPMLEYWLERMAKPRSPLLARLAGFGIGVLIAINVALPLFQMGSRRAVIVAGGAALAGALLWAAGVGRRTGSSDLRLCLWRRPLRFRFSRDAAVLAEHLLAPVTEREHLLGLLALQGMSRATHLWLSAVLCGFAGVALSLLAIASPLWGPRQLGILAAVAVPVAGGRLLLRAWLRGQVPVMCTLRLVQAVNYYILSGLGTMAYLRYLGQTLVAASTIANLVMGVVVGLCLLAGFGGFLGLALSSPETSLPFSLAVVAVLLLLPHTPVVRPMQRVARMNARYMIEQGERALRNWRRICMHSLAEHSKAPTLYIL
jgi:hypothetical protein